MSTAVTVGGTPKLNLNDGGAAVYATGSGTSTLAFVYTVGAGQNTPALGITGVTLPAGATVRDASGANATFAGAVTSFARLQIDTTAPRTLGYPDGLALEIPGAIGQQYRIVGASKGGDPHNLAEPGGIVTLYNGATPVCTVRAASDGSWVCTTALPYGNLTTGQYYLNATVTDAAGNISARSVAENIWWRPTSPALIASVTASPAGGTVGAGQVITLTMNIETKGAPVAATVTGAPTLSLNDGGTARYAGGSGTSALTFAYTVRAGENTNELAIAAVNLPSGAAIASGGNPVDLTTGLGRFPGLAIRTS